MRFYSQSTRGFYIKSVHGDAIPSDAVPISQELFDQVVTHRPASSVIILGDNGLPTLRAMVMPTADQQLQEAYAAKVIEIDRACESMITAGFTSPALGELHRYSSELTDQLNLTGSIQAGVDMPYPCYDEQGLKAFRDHTASQLRQAGDDFTLYRLQLLQRANEIKQQLDQALVNGDVDALQAITWEGVQV